MKTKTVALMLTLSMAACSATSLGIAQSMLAIYKVQVDGSAGVRSESNSRYIVVDADKAQSITIAVWLVASEPPVPVWTFKKEIQPGLRAYELVYDDSEKKLKIVETSIDAAKIALKWDATDPAKITPTP